jgi:phosphinothricin acetyltransferase
VKDSFRNQGIGKKLIQAVLEEGKKADLHTVISRIAGGNSVSINLHHQFGFEDIGVMRDAGNKFGQLLDVYMLQKIYRK